VGWGGVEGGLDVMIAGIFFRLHMTHTDTLTH